MLQVFIYKLVPWWCH